MLIGRRRPTLLSSSVDLSVSVACSQQASDERQQAVRLDTAVGLEGPSGVTPTNSGRSVGRTNLTVGPPTMVVCLASDVASTRDSRTQLAAMAAVVALPCMSVLLPVAGAHSMLCNERRGCGGRTPSGQVWTLGVRLWCGGVGDTSKLG